MKKSIERLAGDTEGLSYEFPVYRFEGGDPAAPGAYLQAALHGNEMPGAAAIHALMPLLREAEAEGRIRGAVTIVPWANPIGRSEYFSGDVQGRFHIATRTNFNRDFPLVKRPDAAELPGEDGLETVDRRLKARLLALSLGHEIVLDLHCDDEGVAYLYVPEALWPAMEDCAAAMGVDAVILWGGSSGASFDEASVHPHLAAGGELSRIVVSTVEFRGRADVGRETAENDARGLYRLLAGRGVIADEDVRPSGGFRGVVAPIDHVEMMPSPRAGFVLYDVVPGDRVEKGQRLATVVHAPGEEQGATDILAPQAGYIMTRRACRQVRAHEDLLKLVGGQPSASAKAGALED
ncbi:MAG: succinylglutamate desuccinylase/aspartoacylase family protein [Rhizobiales bacterium]|nr:succinylglutamate desuccinylase/aspartoacylase family protein [Hyphomicrobiales bacterium]